MIEANSSSLRCIKTDPNISDIFVWNGWKKVTGL